jgi:hypothetical protein
MVYMLDPGNSNGGCFLFDDLDEMIRGFSQPWGANLPIPASYFPRSMTVVKATRPMPDIFHWSRGLIVYSERARALLDTLAPGQVEFIPVVIQAKTPKLAERLKLDTAYYFSNVLGRAQRVQWLETPVTPLPPTGDGIERFYAQSNYRKWAIRPRLPEEPVIWTESWWRVDNREYRKNVTVFLEDELWQALDSRFRGQLHPCRVGTELT